MVIEKDEWWALSLSSFWAFERKKIQSRTGVKISLVPHLFKQVKTRAQCREPSGETGWLQKKFFLD